MTESGLDPVVQRAVDELRRLPPATPDAIARVVGAAAAARISPADEPLIAPPRARALGRWMAIGGIAAGLVGVAIVGIKQMRDRSSTPGLHVVSAVVEPARAPSPVSRDVRQVSSLDPDAAPLPHQFVYQSTTAHRISVVGDFNAWDPSDAPMARDPHTNLWSITLPIVPGRHVYGFMIDDTLFALDPQQPKTRDPDLGTAGSVIIVGKP